MILNDQNILKNQSEEFSSEVLFLSVRKIGIQDHLGMIACQLCSNVESLFLPIFTTPKCAKMKIIVCECLEQP